ncbi:uncharacterized protein CIMG_13231 [Coccidioides immitis RS]|uniref:Uncharacterized protein n=1 Tax=Coccidioides immitis (strain RS) TaxID=246410 RepID=J3K5B8_COCIM|nr:uncharacterized protein CIMG_13231 [Coccidioides immitis RS]EAS29610.3 hypothetical protein CIMG_13231 [Coccidioides immitis RS]
MAELPRWRWKAVDGLDKIPSIKQEWLEMVTMYSLMDAKLQDLCFYGDFDAIDDHPAPSKPSILPNIELPEEILDKISDEIPDPWTCTETLVVDFMVNLLGGLACLLQPLAYQTVCMANAFETTYQFGPLLNGPTTSNHIQFRAHIDRSISFSLPPDKNLPEMIIFEAKHAHHESGQGVPVMGQQSMEHVAYI